jgi:hypothetical protein
MNLNNFYEINKINPNSGGVYCLKILNNNKIGFITNYLLKIYNLINYNEINTIKDPFNQFIYFIQLNDENIILSSNQNQMFLYQINNNKFNNIQTIKGHLKPVIKIIEMFNNNLISLSLDLTMKIWKKDFNNVYMNISTIFCNNKINDLFEIKQNYLITDCINNSISIWDLKKEIKIDTINNIYVNSYINDYFLKFNNLILYCGKNFIYSIDLNTFKLLQSFNNQIYNLTICKFNNNSFLIGNNKGDIIQYNLINNKIELKEIKKNAHNDYINNIFKLNDFIFISCGNDGLLKIWNKK